MDGSDSVARQFHTTQQAAVLLGVSAPTVIKWVKDGRLAAHKTPGGHRRIADEELRSFALSCGRSFGGDSAAGSSGRPKLKVVVVDSERDFSEMVAEYFALQSDVQVTQVSEPLKVGHAIGSIQPDVVVFDVDSPRIHLREFVDLVNELSGVRVVLLSSGWTPETTMGAEECSNASMVQKPVKLDHLWSLVRPIGARTR